jgi:xanthosine utilization system XapX-like protein
MDRDLVPILHILGLLGVLAATEVLVFVWNVFGAMSSVLVHKGGLTHVIDHAPGARTGSLLPHVSGTAGGH